MRRRRDGHRYDPRAPVALAPGIPRRCGTASVDVFSLLRKPDLVTVPVPLRYLGFDIPADFVAGYGMDYAQRYRNLSYIATLKF